MLHNINYTDLSFNNLEIIDNLYINNLNFNKTIFNINIILHTDISNNYYIDLQNSNYTFLIQNINSPIYKKNITECEKNIKTLFYSKNHNLKINDIIYIDNIDSLLNTNLLNTFLLFKVTHTTTNTFNLISFNNIDNSLNNLYDITHSSSLLNNCFFNLISNKTFKQITSVQKFNKIISPNHGLQLHNIIQLINIKYNNQNILFEQYINMSNLFIINSIIDNNTFEITHFINNSISLNNDSTNIFKTDSIITYGFFKIFQSNNLDKNINFILPTNNTKSIGYFYDIIINDNSLNSFSIKTTNSDKLIGFSKFSSQNITGSDFIYTSSHNSTNFSISNLDISQSKFKIINISKNTWLLKSYIYNNKYIYNITYNTTNNSILFNNNTLKKRISLYKNFIYEFNISDSSLLNNQFIITDNNNNNFFKNILNFGICGTSNSKIIFYIDDTFINNTLYNIKYINTSISTIKYDTTLFGIINTFSNPFY